MAQSLENRINAALRSSARLKDVESVISDVEAEISATQAKLDAETARSVDPALTTPQAREARNNAADIEHDLRRLNASLGMLKETRDRIAEDAEADRRLSAYEAARAERDALAIHIRARYPQIALEMLELVKRIDESNRQCEAVNNQRPSGAKPLLPAEFLARECGHYWGTTGTSPVKFFSQIELPLLGSSGRYLPIQHRTMDDANVHWANAIERDKGFAAKPVPGVAIPTSVDAAAA